MLDILYYCHDDEDVKWYDDNGWKKNVCPFVVKPSVSRSHINTTTERFSDRNDRIILSSLVAPDARACCSSFRLQSAPQRHNNNIIIIILLYHRYHKHCYNNIDYNNITPVIKRHLF